MSIISKQTFIGEVKEWLSDKLTAKDSDAVLRGITELLGVYEMERCKSEEENQKEFSEMMELFFSAKSVEGMSKNTMYQYRYNLDKFREFDNTPIRQLTVFNFRQYLAKEKKRGLSDATLANQRCSFHSFFGWLYREGLLPADPCANLSPIKRLREVKLPFSDVELEKIRSACENPRETALVSYLLSTGCRVSEVVGTNYEDIDFQRLQLKVVGKGNKERLVYLNPVASMHLQTYLRSRKDNDSALFVGKGDKRFQKGGIELCLKKIGERAGVENVHPHRFRRTLATTLAARGMPIQEIQKILGHSKIETTMRYINVSDSQVQVSFRKYA